MHQCKKWEKESSFQCPGTAVEGSDVCALHGGIDQENIKKHWYCFSYIGHAVDGFPNTHASLYVGYVDKGVTMAMIKGNKSQAGVKDDAVLISCSYLGEMTAAEFKGK